jgi:hypothetical protein
MSQVLQQGCLLLLPFPLPGREVVLGFVREGIAVNPGLQLVSTTSDSVPQTLLVVLLLQLQKLFLVVE